MLAPGMRSNIPSRRGMGKQFFTVILLIAQQSMNLQIKEPSLTKKYMGGIRIMSHEMPSPYMPILKDTKHQWIMGMAVSSTHAALKGVECFSGGNLRDHLLGDNAHSTAAIDDHIAKCALRLYQHTKNSGSVPIFCFLISGGKESAHDQCGTFNLRSQFRLQFQQGSPLAMVWALNKAAPSQCAHRNAQSHPRSRDPLHYCSKGGTGLWTFIGTVPFLSTVETINISPVSPRRIRNRTSPSRLQCWSLRCWLPLVCILGWDSALVWLSQSWSVHQ